MSLKDIVVKTRPVVVDGGKFTVRGITIADLTDLSKNYTKELGTLLDTKGDISALIGGSPDFVAALIAAASGEPECVAEAKSLPAGIQLSTLMTIWELSAISEEDLGNALRGVVRFLQTLNEAIVTQRADSADTKKT
jgi:hypothetical protein